MIIVIIRCIVIQKILAKTFNFGSTDILAYHDVNDALLKSHSKKIAIIRNREDVAENM